MSFPLSPPTPSPSTALVSFNNCTKIFGSRTRRWDDSDNCAVRYILESVATEKYREHWNGRKRPALDRATIPQLLGSYCYDPPRNADRGYWYPALKSLYVEIDEERQRPRLSNWSEPWEEEYMKQLSEVKTRAKKWYESFTENPSAAPKSSGSDDNTRSSKYTDEPEPSEDTIINEGTTQPDQSLDLWREVITRNFNRSVRGERNEREGSFDDEQ